MRFKKVVLLFLLITLSIFPVQVVFASNDKTTSVDFDALGTYVTYVIGHQAEGISKAEAQTHLNEARKLTNKLSDLSDNFYPKYLDDENEVLMKNVHYINNHPNQKIEIDKMLYDLLFLSEEYKTLTNGYFDVSIGLIIDEWKTLLTKTDDPNYPNDYISKKEYKAKVEAIKAIPVIQNGISLQSLENKYYVQIKDGVKIDLGGVAKGYAVELVDQLFKSKGLKYYHLEGSGSSLKYGLNHARETNEYWIGITHPYITPNSIFEQDGLYGRVRVKETGITTSGDTVQKATLHGTIIHHIISPITKIPENNYRSLTLIENNSAYGDALSTAMFAMNEETLEKWNQDKGIEYIAIRYSGDVIEKFTKTKFEVLNKVFDRKPDIIVDSSEFKVKKMIDNEIELSLILNINNDKTIREYSILNDNLDSDDYNSINLVLKYYFDNKIKINALGNQNNLNNKFQTDINLILDDLNEYIENYYNGSKLESEIIVLRHYYEFVENQGPKQDNAQVWEWVLISGTIILLGVGMYFLSRKKESKEKED